MAHPYTHTELVSYCLKELDSAKLEAITTARLSDAALDEQILELEQLLQLSQQESIETPSASSALARFEQRRKKSRFRNYRMAAAMAGLLLLTAASFLFFQEPVAVIALNAGNEMETYQLPDGSYVTLSPGTSLQYEEGFIENRNIELIKGKAFFDVVKQAGAPFLVQAGNSEVKVLGTRFDVRLNAQETRVNLQEGSVAFSCPAGNLLLKPMQQAVFAANELRHMQHIVSKTFNWTTHRLQFKETTLKEVASILQERFNENIQVSETSVNCTLTGSFSEERLEDILDVIALTINGNITSSPAGFSIESPGCQ